MNKLLFMLSNSSDARTFGGCWVYRYLLQQLNPVLAPTTQLNSCMRPKLNPMAAGRATDRLQFCSFMRRAARRSLDFRLFIALGDMESELSSQCLPSRQPSAEKRRNCYRLWGLRICCPPTTAPHRQQPPPKARSMLAASRMLRPRPRCISPSRQVSPLGSWQILGCCSVFRRSL